VLLIKLRFPDLATLDELDYPPRIQIRGG